MNNNRLTEGNIFKSIIKLALPIMGTSFVQMAYNMTDMIWIGRVGSKAVAAVGTAGFFTWLGMAFILISKIGAEVGVAQSIGKKDIQAAKKFIRHTIQINILLALLYGTCLFIFRNQLISLFNLRDVEVINMAVNYLKIIALGIVFFFINPIFTAILNGYGNSKTPFIINTIGLIINMVLDPLLILGLGPLPALGVKGAALATITAQFIVTMIFVYNANNMMLFSEIHLFKLPKVHYVKRIVKIGLPVAMQSGLFTIFAMMIARIIANWGEIPIAVQKVGSQIEAISWMTASGFSTAISAFVGQNYGANKWERIYKGYFTAIGIVSIVGVIATCLLIFGARPIFSIFIPEEEAIRQGVIYLRILGLSQLFMCIEITTAGAFNGLGKTLPPSIVSIVLTGLRVPASMVLSSSNLLGLNGVWWSISMSSVFKGIILMTWFIILLVKSPYFKKDKLELFLKKMGGKIKYIKWGD
ncbi:MATE family efflux transporter [Caloranaerobacter ferrireducens]|uniref:MATE family efflux transporter n=1 Tax=Caloranaerobacter ferrireducens TaxID=1323370 RepID=UPI00084DD4AE|nr:MATE family efflux transporter [Caloranaerobacter ferrireducens]